MLTLSILTLTEKNLEKILPVRGTGTQNIKVALKRSTRCATAQSTNMLQNHNVYQSTVIGHEYSYCP